MDGVQGFMYPNEMELQWSILIVLYPFITGLVAGAFILASLERVFDVQAVKPTYRLALLTALAFMLVAPLPLQLHLGHPERSFEMYLTPHTTSAMAMFGFVYLWYLMAVLVVEIWLEYRKEIVIAWQRSSGIARAAYGLLALGSSNVSDEALRVDDRAGRLVTIVGIPSAFLLHGYVGFIFGSVKANPWWSTPMMPITRLPSLRAASMATGPPIEWPTRMICSEGTADSAVATSCPKLRMVHSARLPSVPPCPARSTVTTVWCCLNTGTCSRQ